MQGLRVVWLFLADVEDIMPSQDEAGRSKNSGSGAKEVFRFREIGEASPDSVSADTSSLNSPIPQTQSFYAAL